MKNLIQSIYDQVRLEIENENNVENLIGTKLIWKNDHYNNGEEIPAVVAAIAEGVGYTMVAEHDTQLQLSCSNGPLSPNKTSKGFRIAWEYAISAIKEGYYDVQKVRQLRGRAPHGVDGPFSSCAFK